VVWLSVYRAGRDELHPELHWLAVHSESAFVYDGAYLSMRFVSIGRIQGQVILLRQVTHVQGDIDSASACLHCAYGDRGDVVHEL
jgi:hypothetical protein